jgi:Kef-type K+ transport system membrane component KefB
MTYRPQGKTGPVIFLGMVQYPLQLTAAALLVVLGAALLMQVSGLTMAMGAFLAGVLLSE